MPQTAADLIVGGFVILWKLLGTPVFGFAMGTFQHIIVAGMDGSQHFCPFNMERLAATLAPERTGCDLFGRYDNHSHTGYKHKCCPQIPHTINFFDPIIYQRCFEIKQDTFSAYFPFFACFSEKKHLYFLSIRQSYDCGGEFRQKKKIGETHYEEQQSDQCSPGS